MLGNYIMFATYYKSVVSLIFTVGFLKEIHAFRIREEIFQ